MGTLLLLVSISSLLLITAGGWHYYHRQYDEAQKNAWDGLAAVADLKARGIANWVSERRGDAEVARMSAAIRNVAAHSNNTQSLAAASVPVDVFRRVYRYAAIITADSQGRIVMQVSPDLILPAATVAEQIRIALNSQQVEVSDLIRSQPDQPVYLYVACPVFTKLQTNGAPDGAFLI